MSKKKKTTNSLTKLLEKSKNISTNVNMPDNKQQIVDETKILRPYLEPNNSSNNLLNIEHISTTKSSTYRPHIEHISATESSTYRAHIEHISTTYRPHIEHISTTISTTESTTKSTTKISYLEAKKTFSCLSKTQKKILLHIYNSCKQLLSKISASITVNEFSICCNLKKKSVKTTLRRLEKSNIIILRSFKRGRQGWRKYEIPENVYQEILLINITEPKSTTISTTESTTESTTTPTLVSSSYITTTTYLPEEFRKIDCSPLKDIGFDDSHIIQIHREHAKNQELILSAEIIQNSINAFAFDLKHNDIASAFKNSPALVLTSLLKKGQPYSSKTPEKVLTPKEEALQEYLRAQEIKQQKINDIRNKAKELALQEWLNSLSTEDLLNFNQEPRLEGIPDKVYQTSRKKKAIEFAKDYFNIVLWPEKLNQILNDAEQLNVLQEET